MKKKILALILCAVMAATAVVGGTLAYFTDTDAETNVFTVGNIDIDLREWEEDETNEFEDVDDIMPGETYPKIVDVENIGKNDAFVKVTIDIPEDMIPTWNDAAVGVGKAWVPADNNPKAEDEGYPAGKYVFYYTEKLTPGDVTDNLLEKVTLSPSVTELTAADKYEVEVTAAGIQADSFNDWSAAMAALNSAENVANTVTASDIDKLNAALAADAEDAVVQLPADVTAKTSVVMANTDSVLDGNGNKLTKTTTDDNTNAGVLTNGGMIKNIEITGETSTGNKGFRAVFATSDLTADLVLENVILDGTYAMNVMGSGDSSIIVKNSTLNGWTSYGSYKSAEFTDVTFGKSIAGYEHLRPYTDTVLTNCTFSTDFTIASDAGAKDNFTITLTNCKVGDTLITAENFQNELVGSYTDSVYVAALIDQATVVVDGVTVVWAK